MEGPGVARNYTAHLFSMQAKCYRGEVAEARVRTTMPPQPLCGVRATGWQKVRLKFLYTLIHSRDLKVKAEGGEKERKRPRKHCRLPSHHRLHPHNQGPGQQATRLRSTRLIRHATDPVSLS